MVKYLSYDYRKDSWLLREVAQAYKNVPWDTVDVSHWTDEDFEEWCSEDHDRYAHMEVMLDNRSNYTKEDYAERNKRDGYTYTDPTTNLVTWE